jgi:hypothetical protein
MNYTLRKTLIPVLFASALTAGAAIAEEKAKTPPVSGAQAVTPDGPLDPKTANNVIGLPALESGGQTVGQVVEIGQGSDTKSNVVVIKVSKDFGPEGTTVAVPMNQVVVKGRTAQLYLNKDELKKLVK